MTTRSYVPDFLFDGRGDSPVTLAPAHGAGASMVHSFMNSVAAGVARAAVRVARFEFPYMRATRIDGKRRPPDPAPVLVDAWKMVVEALGGGDRLVIGGKSVGGRIASLIADEAAVAGLVCLGYPFHPPGKPDRLRVEHLADLRTPTLIVQGERDRFGSRAEAGRYSLTPAITVQWALDGDHSFRPRRASGKTEAQNLHVAIDLVVAFTERLTTVGPAAD